MALTISLVPGYSFVEGELVDYAKLNALGNPTINLEGSVGTLALADGSVTTPKLVDGVLSADAAGRLKMADGFVTTNKLTAGVLSADATGLTKMADGYLAASAAGRLKMADGFLTPAKVDTASYATTAEQSAAGNTTLTVAHGLGVIPVRWNWVLRCKSVEFNYAVGDELDGQRLFQTTPGSGNAPVAFGHANATNLVLVLVGTALWTTNATSSSAVQLTNANWRWVGRATLF